LPAGTGPAQVHDAAIEFDQVARGFDETGKFEHEPAIDAHAPGTYREFAIAP
jgi:hypothetical protein